MSNFRVEIPGKHCTNKLMKINVPSGVSGYHVTSGGNVVKFTSVIFLHPQNT